MKFSSVLAVLTILAVAASAAPCKNKGSNNHKSGHDNVNAISQQVGDVGNEGRTSGLLNGLLKGGIASDNSKTSNVNQHASIQN
ncbi:uncharacterized protein BYT42DRAFT_610949 [Radiomyces spectabilis]|uniref:uncharacterized protein n=1 Tax=Radiomyces spectabilis TaxID=64574 RepID=UPI00221EE4A2|nr:uncharacterized protein BYT42DRAFT_610949 [Radiomyces spectabilis]KAI8391756.1 hypothetical protein BYT42DRAFT_610949 [Radiomyces spectabilis]